MTTAAIIIAFRDRGIDPLRQQNLDCVLDYWNRSGLPVHVVDDGLAGDAHFNRHRAYNRGASATDAEVLCYIESDILLPYEQLHEAIRAAAMLSGLVVPFSHQFKLGEADSAAVRGGAEPDDFEPEQVHLTWSTSINQGCASVVSRESLDAVGQWDEQFCGHGHDDTAMMIAFHHVCGPTRYMNGNAYHLYHLEMDPGLTSAEHITPEDARAQERNRYRLGLYRQASTPAAIRELTAGTTRDWRVRYQR